MSRFDLAISYTWEFDEEFVNLLEIRLQKHGLRTFVIKKFNVHEVAELLRTKKISFKAYLDRASDEDPDFEAITRILRKRKCHIINPHHKARKVTDKAFMHKKLAKKNFLLPKTYIIQPYDRDEELKITFHELRLIGIPFIIKPSLFSGGGEGVEKNASTIEQIQNERIKSHSEKYLVQEKIYPRSISGKRAWFRIFWAFNKVIPCWWDDHTHIYEPVTSKQIKRFHLQQLIKITRRLARLTFLDYFSTEIALTKKHQFILIDYINDQCDMRLKSLHPDGVPDEVVIQLIEEMKKKIISL
ncbi:MAG: hypothetical protein AB1521_17040 [Bacteroidota bacterium]